MKKYQTDPSSREYPAHATRSLIIPVLLIALLISSCSKEDPKPYDNKYLVSFKEENIFPLQSIINLLSPMEPLYPEAAGIKDHAQYSVQVISIIYKSHYKGEEINASGLVCIPLAKENFPVISFQNGTNTYHGNAPTADPTNLNYLILESMASNGYIIVIPDYIGFGISAEEVHPYYQKETTCATVIDMIYACKELVLNDVILAKNNNTQYLMGYSQGGWATLSVLEQLEKTGQADINVSAASCGAGAYDLMSMSDYVMSLETFPGPLYLPYFVYSEQVYGALMDPLTKFFNDPYAGLIPELFNGEYTNTQVNAALNDTISRLLTPDLLANFSSGPDFKNLRDVLTENSIQAWDVNALLRLYHGSEDLNVPPRQSQAMHDSLIAAGSDPQNVILIDLEGLNHETGVIPWGIKTINWFNELEDE